MPRMPSILPTARTLLSLLALTGLSAAFSAGCVLYGGEDGERSCADVVCGNHATCGANAECYCDAGYGGNPYDGCKSVQPPVDPDCKLECGQNAYCSEGACYCELDHVAVCGTNAGCLPEARLCDERADCPDSADENVAVCQPPVFQDWIITDACDDGLDIEWRLFALDRDWAWPGIDTVWTTRGLLVDSYATIQCFAGETICTAQAAGSRTWGLALDGSGDCDSCCFTCGAEPLFDAGYLECSQ